MAVALSSATVMTDGSRAWAEPSASAAVPSSLPVTAKSSDGWTLVLSANGETLMPAPPLDPAVPTRDFVARGLFHRTMRGPNQATTPTPAGTIAVGYQVQCLPNMLGALKPSVVDFKVLSEEFSGADPSAVITDFRVQVDCSGRAFVRSYAVLTRTTNSTNSVVAYCGVPTPV
ncbi:MspA family porin [Mycobacterium syngnathidarum]